MAGPQLVWDLLKEVALYFPSEPPTQTQAEVIVYRLFERFTGETPTQAVTELYASELIERAGKQFDETYELIAV